jgi:hypothetical protein
MSDLAPSLLQVGELTDRERELLDFERTWWRYQGAREDEIRRRFAMTATRHAQVVNALVDRPAAIAYAPDVCRRWRERRSRRAG